MNMEVLQIHSRMSQSARTRTSENFRTGTNKVLFSSDVSARGMDYPDVTFVFQIGSTEKAQAFSGFESDIQADWRASHPEQSDKTVRDVVAGKDVGQGVAIRTQTSKSVSKGGQDSSAPLLAPNGKPSKLTRWLPPSSRRRRQSISRLASWLL